MKWFQGSIADAVSASKSTNAIFIVYIEGSDELSKTMSTVMDSGKISSELASSKFVCIKLTKDSESHKQFTEIYKIVPVPALFFIGENGVPLEIIAGDNSADNVNKKIISALSKIKGSPITPEDVSTQNKETSPTVSDKPDSSVKETASIFTAPNSTPTSSTTPTNDVTSEADSKKAADMERVQELIKKKREENQRLEEEKEKERELSRRRMGKEIAQAKKTQQDKELEQMRKDREKERKLEAEARQKVLRQIEEDKANRAAKMTASQQAQSPLSPQPSSTDNTEKPTSPVYQANEGRIQFKLPDGQTRTQTFPATTTLRELRMFIDNNITVPFNEYTLATTFPRREYSSRDLSRDLADLELLPSSVILILPVKGNTAVMKGPGWTAALSALFWGLVQPVFDFGSYLRYLITGRRGDNNPSSRASTSQQREERTDQQQPTRPPYYQSLGGSRNVRKRGNVHTLSDGNDSNDENNTWNGNSTQLM